jgi:hypothetical protein
MPPADMAKVESFSPISGGWLDCPDMEVLGIFDGEGNLIFDQGAAVPSIADDDPRR